MESRGRMKHRMDGRHAVLPGRARDAGLGTGAQFCGAEGAFAATGSQGGTEGCLGVTCTLLSGHDRDARYGTDTCMRRTGSVLWRRVPK